MTRVFVYYRVPADRLAAAVDASRALHRRLGVAMELWRRPEPADGRVTLMEVYDAADAVTVEPAAAQALAGLIDGPRHVERFVPAD